MIILVLWANYVYKAAVMNSKSKISWHRLVNVNMYVIILKTKERVWEIEISLNGAGTLITSGIDNEEGTISINVPKNRTLHDIVSHAGVLNLSNPELELFFRSLTNPIQASPLFPNKNDFESYNEVIFYITTSMEQT